MSTRKLSSKRVALAFIAVALAATASGQASDTWDVDIPAGELASALKTLARQTGLELIFQPDLVRGLQTSGVKGTLSPRDAVVRLLDGTNLTIKQDRGGALLIGESDAAQGTSTSATPRTQSEPPAGSASEASTQIGEIIVSAQKRDEHLLDVPVPVTALSAQSLASENRLRIQDYVANVPGLNLMPSIQSQQTLSIRGVTTGSGNPTVGVTVDEVPYGASTNIGGGRSVPDIDPGDLARVEVLRGPQGTLYGANSLGGLLKFVTVDPSMQEFSGRLQAGMSHVESGDDAGYNVRGSMNVPVSDSVAIRASAFARRDAGYVDNVQTNEADINEAEATGGRASVLWSPSERFSLKLSMLLQRIEGEGSVSADPALGNLRQSRLRDTGWYDREVQAYAATLSAMVGGIELTSISGYNVNSYSDSFDLTYALSPSAQSLYGAEFSGVSLLSANRTEKLTQEMRIEGSLGEQFDWLAGVFYTDEDSGLTDDRIAVSPLTGVSPGRLVFSNFLTTLEEAAVFANLTWRVTDRFDVQFGGRHSEIEQSYEQINLSATGVQTGIPELSIDAGASTFLVTPRLRLTPDVMLYARIASGYRVGGPNINPGGVVPEQYRPDKTLNYELGLKAELLSGKFLLDASLYQIDWEDIQVNLVLNNFNFTTNGSKARSRGVELTAELRPVTGLRVLGWTVWNEAELTEPLPPGAANTPVGAAGERLPITARFSANLSVDQEFALTDRFDGFIGAGYSYVGDRIGPFRAVAVRERFPSYTQVDVRAGVRNAAWTVTLFGTNLGDERGRLYGGLGANPPTAYTYIQPRTYGLSVTKLF